MSNDNRTTDRYRGTVCAGSVRQTYSLHHEQQVAGVGLVQEASTGGKTKQVTAVLHVIVCVLFLLLKATCRKNN